MDFRELEVWKQSMDLTEEIYRITRPFPKEEMFGLTGQMRRSALSIPSNIAEGNGRKLPNDYVRFLRISLGSLLEVITQLELARRMEFVPAEIHSRLLEKCNTINKMLASLIKVISK